MVTDAQKSIEEEDDGKAKKNMITGLITKVTISSICLSPLYKKGSYFEFSLFLF